MGAKAREYEDFVLRFEPAPRRTFRVSAHGPGDAVGHGTLRLPFGQKDLELFVLRLGLAPAEVRSNSSPHLESAKKFGQRLFDAVMRDDVERVYSEARARADAAGKGVRIMLEMSQAPQLMDVPWEFLHDGDVFLAGTERTPIVRSLDTAELRFPIELPRTLRILGIISTPSDCRPLDAARERDRLDTALAPLAADGRVEVEWLPHATLGAIEERISDPSDLHIVHYIGHGGFDRVTGESYLSLENDAGTSQPATADDLLPLVIDEDSLRLAVLNACEGARTSEKDAFSSVASGLAKCIPAVVGMQFPISEEAARIFAPRFYGALAHGLPVDVALAQARKTMATRVNVEFGTPVLFLRGQNAKLFDIAEALTRAPEPRSKRATQTAGVAQKAKPKAHGARPKAQKAKPKSPAPGADDGLSELRRRMSGLTNDPLFASAWKAVGDADPRTRAEALSDLGKLLLGARKYHAAEAAFAAAVACNQDPRREGELRLHLADALRLEHRFDRAVDAYREAVALLPTTKRAAAFHGLGRSLVGCGRRDAAEATYREAAGAGIAEAWLWLGDLCAEAAKAGDQKAAERARDAYLSAVSAGRPSGHLGVARMERMLFHYPEALAAVENALAAKQKTVRTAGRDEALVLARKANSTAPQVAVAAWVAAANAGAKQAWIQLAEALRARNDIGRAAQAYTAAADAGIPDAWITLGEMLEQADDPAGAAQAYERGIALGVHAGLHVKRRLVAHDARQHLDRLRART